MTERQLIILRTLIDQVQAKSRLNFFRNCFEQSGPLDLSMEFAEFIELDNIKNQIDNLLANLSQTGD